jgi:lipopolysaccharide/colanic/teichoic acid biosynthesis glycosyltransferase
LLNIRDFAFHQDFPLSYVGYANFMSATRSVTTYPTHSFEHISGLLTPKQLDLAIAKERMRADRYQLKFSVVIFRVKATSEANRQSQYIQLTTILDSRLRITDERGHRSNGSVGILLPHTHEVGARIVLDSLRDLAKQQSIYFEDCRIYVYPSLSECSVGDVLQNEVDEELDGILGSDAGGAVERASSFVMTNVDHLRHQDASEKIGDASQLIVPAYPKWKRIVDIVLASVGLFISLPVLLLAAIAIRLSSTGPAFFSQWRTGEFGKPFQIIKLRTMVVDAEELKAKLHEMNERDGPAFKMKYDPRVTRVGRFLRATGLDELPQLVNVLKGDMSIVGPRPLPCSEAANCKAWQRRRLDTKPGITCFWQIMKSRVEAFDDWMRLDLQYLSKRSFFQDIRLIAKTVLAVIFGRVGH